MGNIGKGNLKDKFKRSNKKLKTINQNIDDIP